MGNIPGGAGGEGGPPQGGERNGKEDPDGAEKKKKKKRFEPRPANRQGRRRRRKGPSGLNKTPTIVPTSKCKLRLLKLERVKDYLLMEEEFIRNQELLKPREEQNESEQAKVDDIRGSPMS